jgi:elongation factor 1-alpha
MEAKGDEEDRTVLPPAIDLPPIEVYEKERERAIRLCIVGSVDAGKSSWTGVIKTDKLDDGKGSAREHVAVHQHEIDYGRTSDISIQSIRITDKTRIIVHDLCGHERYLKTTIRGLYGSYAEYAIGMIACNRGILPMTDQHLLLTMHSRIKLILFITKVDLALKDEYNMYRTSMARYFGNKGFSLIALNNIQFDKEKKIDFENSTSEEKTMRMIDKSSDDIHYKTKNVLILHISSKTGYGIAASKHLLSQMRPQTCWDAKSIEGSIFHIDGVYCPPHVGLVVSGILQGNTVTVGDSLSIGPYNGKYVKIKIKSMHGDHKNLVDSLYDGEKGCFGITFINKKEKLSRHQLRKGMVVIKPDDLVRYTAKKFRAKIKVIAHKTTISDGYAPVIHTQCVRQSAKITLEPDKKLRAGDYGNVNFEFLFRPEFVNIGDIFSFRESTTHGVGKIIDIVPLGEDADEMIDRK